MFVSVRRALKRASLRDLSVDLLRTAASLYQVGFAIYLPVARYTSLPGPIKYRWLAFLAVSIVMDKGLVYVPKKPAKRWELVEIERLKATGVAVARMNQCMRNRDLSDGDFGEIARGLLTAIRFDVETLVADQTGFYINVSLLVEDWEDEEKLRVVARANPSRINRSYFKRDLFVATAMEEQKVRFESNFAQAGKPYRSILAIPMILEGEASLQTIGVISIDSGRRGEFYQEVAINLEQRLSPYVNLLGLLLVMQAELRKDELDGPVA